MNVILKLLCVGGYLVAASAMADPSREEAGGAIRLSESQMDSVTAGAVFVNVEAFAVAVGEAGYTLTDTTTRVISRRFVEIAKGTATAVACCGDGTIVGVSLSGGGDGTIVHVKTNIVTVDTPEYDMVRGSITVISINPPDLGSEGFKRHRHRAGSNRFRPHRIAKS